MTLRKKAIIFFLVFFLGWFAIVSVILTNEIIKGYTNIEELRFDWEIERAQTGLETLINKHRPLLLDWTNWDEAYAFVQYPNDIFLEDIIESNHFVDQEMNYLILFDYKDQVIYAGGYDLEMQRSKPIPQSFIRESLKHKNKSGLFYIEGEPIVFFTRQVSNNDGSMPAMGLFVFGFDLSNYVVSDLANSIQEPLTIEDKFIESMVEDALIAGVSPQYSNAYIDYPYANEAGGIRFKVKLNHDILNLGKSTLRGAMVLFAASFAFLLIIVMMTVGRVVKRLARLVSELSEINKEGHLTERVSEEGNDEIGILRSSINFLLDELQDVHTQLLHHASYDELTGVYNRRAGLEKLEKEIEKVSVTGNSLTIVFVDINGLKYVNDKLGHHVGDDYLIHACHGIKMVMDLDDIIARIGGDEFLIIFPRKNKEVVRKIFSPVHSILEKIHDQYSLPYKMSVSAGIFEYEPGMDVDTFIESADQLMYREKELHKKGKNEPIVSE